LRGRPARAFRPPVGGTVPGARAQPRAAGARGLRPMYIERDVPCRLRDGTVLRSDVFRPEGAGRCPVVLLRTPYDKARMALPPERLCAAGYAVVRQDTRGRYA